MSHYSSFHHFLFHSSKDLPDSGHTTEDLGPRSDRKPPLLLLSCSGAQGLDAPKQNTAGRCKAHSDLGFRV